MRDLSKNKPIFSQTNSESTSTSPLVEGWQGGVGRLQNFRLDVKNIFDTDIDVGVKSRMYGVFDFPETEKKIIFFAPF
jgi:hypothetical protein